MSFMELPSGIDEGRPTYVYDLRVLARSCDEFIALGIPGKRLYFATMANDHPEILRCIAGRGIGAFVNSLHHLALALEAGVEPKDLVYASTSMERAEFVRCFELGVHMVVDSMGQLGEAVGLAPSGTSFGIRVHVGSALEGKSLQHEPSYRFGVNRTELAEAVEVARARGMRLSGVHAYFGTNIHDPAILLEGLQRLGACVVEHPELDYIDVGGGFGVPDDAEDSAFDYGGYVDGANELLARLQEARGNPVELRMEPGRSLVSECGAFLVRVRDVKVRSDRVFVGTNASVAQFPRMLLHPESARHPVRLLGPKAGAEPHERPIELTGSSTYSRDFLARGVSMPLPETDDGVLLLRSGAYGRSMLSRFLGKSTPREVVLGEAR